MVRSVGVLLVHGMGVQPEGDTLAYMGDPLLTWAAAWLAGHGGHGYVTGCGMPCSPAGTPRHVHARWKVKEKDESTYVDVLIAEAWWANRFDAPSASRISDWVTPLIWGVGWRGFFAAATTIGVVMMSTEWFSGDWFGSLVLGTLLAVALCILIALLPSALLLVGKLPGKIGDASAGFLNFLVLWVGDVMVYQQNPRNTFEAREKIRHDLHWLTARTETTVIAAHSLGSLLTIDVLSETEESKVKFLATFGCPIKLLRMRKSRYLSRLKKMDLKTGWVNFFDPLDFIGGPVDCQRDFPYNIKVDNARSVLGAHGGYPDNAEQFQDAIYRLIIFNEKNEAAETEDSLAANDNSTVQADSATDEKTEDGNDAGDDSAAQDDTKLKSAFHARWWRSFDGTAFMAISLPAALAGAYLLYRNGWAQKIADLTHGQIFIPAWVRDFIAASVNNLDERQRVAGTLLICLATTTALAIFLLWIGHLVLMQCEARAERSVAANEDPWSKGFRLCLIAIWLVWCLPIPLAVIFYWFDVLHILTLLVAPVLVMAGIVGWICWVRRFRHLEMKPGSIAREGAKEMVTEALGAPFNEIQHSHPEPPNETEPTPALQPAVAQHSP